MNKVVANAAFGLTAAALLGLNVPLRASAATNSTLNPDLTTVSVAQTINPKQASELKIPQTQKVAGVYYCVYDWYTFNGGYSWVYGCY